MRAGIKKVERSFIESMFKAEGIKMFSRRNEFRDYVREIAFARIEKKGVKMKMKKNCNVSGDRVIVVLSDRKGVM